MSDTKLPQYLVFATELQSAGLAVNPSELHGLLTGMLSGGLNSSDNSWQPLLFDYMSEGMAWQTKALQLAQTTLEATSAELSAADFSLELLLPDEAASASLFDIADGLADWVNHFISGLGLVGAELNKAPQDIKEALADLEEIAKLGIDEEDDLDEQAQLLEQVIEHVKVCALTFYAEFGRKNASSEQASSPKAPTIH